jgi:serine phosphatase RsbU (regulator of sigma subunit)
LNIISVDLSTRTIVISRNGHDPVFIKTQQEKRCLDLPSNPIRLQQNMRPVIEEIPLQEGTIIVTFTDGISSAGKRSNNQISWEQIWEIIDNNGPGDAQNIADSILQLAVELDKGRPNDDMSVLVLCIDGEGEDKARRLQLSFPC